MATGKSTPTFHPAQTEDAICLVPQSHTLKTVFLGDSGVGKTCLAKLYLEREVKELVTFTIGFDYDSREVELDDGVTVKVREGERERGREGY